jgi:hypothetical protein
VIRGETFWSAGLAEVSENPRNGTWLPIRRLLARHGDEAELIIVDDIEAVLPGWSGVSSP